MALDRRPARDLYPDHSSLERRYRRPILALVRHHAPHSSSTWIDRDDYAQEAWEAAYRIIPRFGHLHEPDFGNVLVSSVRNSLVNYRKRHSRSSRIQGVYIHEFDHRPDPGDPFRGPRLCADLERVRRRLGERLGPVFDILQGDLLPECIASGRVPIRKLSLTLGRCPDTARARIRELQWALWRLRD